MADKLIIEGSYNIDLQPVLDAVAASADLKADNAIYGELAKVAEAKRQVADALETVEAAERKVKQAINDRAKAQYGPHWDAIQGDGFRITRSFAGSIYDVVEGKENDIDPKFIKIKVTANTDAIDSFREQKNTLPDGIELNPNRSESIRLTVRPQ